MDRVFSIYRIWEKPTTSVGGVSLIRHTAALPIVKSLAQKEKSYAALLNIIFD